MLGWITIIVRLFESLPRLYGIFQGIVKDIEASMQSRRQRRLQEAIERGDTLEAERQMGSIDAGKPTGIPGSGVRGRSEDPGQSVDGGKS